MEEEVRGEEEPMETHLATTSSGPLSLSDAIRHNDEARAYRAHVWSKVRHLVVLRPGYSKPSLELPLAEQILNDLHVQEREVRVEKRLIEERPAPDGIHTFRFWDVEVAIEGSSSVSGVAVSEGSAESSWDKVAVWVPLGEAHGAPLARLLDSGERAQRYCATCSKVHEAGKFYDPARCGWAKNAAIKMARNSARRDLAKRLGGFSEYFSQDLEDLPGDVEEAYEEEQAPLDVERAKCTVWPYGRYRGKTIDQLPQGMITWILDPAKFKAANEKDMRLREAVRLVAEEKGWIKPAQEGSNTVAQGQEQEIPPVTESEYLELQATLLRLGGNSAERASEILKEATLFKTDAGKPMSCSSLAVLRNNPAWFRRAKDLVNSWNDAIEASVSGTQDDNPEGREAALQRMIAAKRGEMGL